MNKIGDRIGPFTLVEKLAKKKRHYWVWLVKCDCGATYERVPNVLRMNVERRGQKNCMNCREQTLEARKTFETVWNLFMDGKNIKEIAQITGLSICWIRRLLQS